MYLVYLFVVVVEDVSFNIFLVGRLLLLGGKVMVLMFFCVNVVNGLRSLMVFEVFFGKFKWVYFFLCGVKISMF